jgi:hypothetical protein
LRKDSGFKLIPEFMKMIADENEKTYKVVVPHDAPFANQPYYKLQSAYDFDLLAWKKTDRLLASENILSENVKEGEILLIATSERNMYKMINEDQLMQLKEYNEVPKVDYYKAIISVTCFSRCHVECSHRICRYCNQCHGGKLIINSARISQTRRSL